MQTLEKLHNLNVTSRMGCVSRNGSAVDFIADILVTSRMGCVSRNHEMTWLYSLGISHIPHGMCE